MPPLPTGIRRTETDSETPMTARRVGIVALLIVGAWALYGFVAPPPAAPLTAARAPELHQSPATTEAIPAAAERPASARTTAKRPQAPQAAEPSPAVPSAPTAPRDHLDVETDLLAAVDGHQGIDVQAVTALIKGDRYGDFMDRLASESAASPLAHDVAELYAQSVAKAHAVDDDQLALRLVCGMTLCAISATAASKDVFDAWFERFIADPVAPPYGAGRHDKVTDSGAIEYRIVFSTDPERQHVVMPRTRPANP